MNTQPRPLPSPPTAAQTAPGALSLQWKRQPLPPRQAVQVLDFRAGEIALLEVEDGRVWVTCDGLLEDYFLEAGQRLSFTGPARLRVSAEGPRTARLLWARHQAEAGATYPPAATVPAPPLSVVPAAAAAPSQPLPRGAISAA
ncbi:DUF2917 domain-containing protein [Acidovorax sp. 1608163]|uniref:DUF2917 domain-containing protein n=1 Tax=Acidovorax sp. 1608163 TaxID=2478662 RepID=UPI000EF6D794|nr:DUF2917 domain-containing protein [Acidovorax sp. 1608163]AYM95365.1 DUF2917 domain-containing protein [Acidovorax sp. 1608163]